MKRVMNTRIAAGLMAAFVSIGAASGASAAILTWGCQGQLGDQRVLFNRDGLYIVDGKVPVGKPKKFTADSVSDAIAELKKSKDTFTEFGPYGDDGLEGRSSFRRSTPTSRCKKSCSPKSRRIPSRTSTA